MSNKTSRIEVILNRLILLLQHHHVKSYLPELLGLITQFRGNPDTLKSRVNELFGHGGMGSLSDLAILKINGHKVEREQEVNYELSALLEALFEEVRYPIHAEEAKRAIKHFRKYPNTKDEWEEELLSGDLQSIFDVLIWITYYHSDVQWVQHWCLTFLDDSNPQARALAASCLADLTHLHQKLDTKNVIPRLQQLIEDPDAEVSNRAERALKEINSELNIFS
jgi:non-SMC mitotic condensation complex subunit 1